MTEAGADRLLARGHNRREWDLLRDGLELEEGFALFVVLVSDAEVERRLGVLLDACAEGQGRESVVASALGSGSRAPRRILNSLDSAPPVLARVETTAASRRDPEALERCFAQLNQARDQLVASVPGPLVILLRPDGLRRLVDVAPDLYSIHRMQLRFVGLGEPAIRAEWVRSLGARGGDRPLASLQAWQLLVDGALDEAEARLGSTEDGGDDAWASLWHDLTEHELLRLRGDLEACVGLGDQVATKLATLIGDTHAASLAFDAARVELLADVARADEAEALAEALWRRFEHSREPSEPVMRAMARLFERLERRARVRAIIRRARALGGEPPPWITALEARSCSEPPHVYLIHRSADKLAATALATALRRDWGVDVWFDGWEIVGGSNIIAKMERGIAAADGGLVLVSKAALGDRYAYEEYAALLNRVIEGKASFLIPVTVDVDDAEATLPPFLAARRRLDHRDVETIARDIYQHMGVSFGDKPVLGRVALPGVLRRELRLCREGDEVHAKCGEHHAQVLLSAEAGRALRARLPRASFVRDAAAHDRVLDQAQDDLRAIGVTLGRVFAGSLGEALATEIHEHAGHAVLSLRADDPELLALPWEAALIPGGLGLRSLALVPELTVVREVDVLPGPQPFRTIDGPLRVLFVVASPHDDLDLEREHQRILDGLERVRLARPRVVFIEEAPTLEALRRQLDAEPFHVVHVSAHGRPAVLLFEDEFGEVDEVDGARLAAALTTAKHPPAVVVLSACWSAGAPRSDTDDEVDRLGLAGELLRAGVSQVIAMQGPVSDGYAGELAGFFYAALVSGPQPNAARALAEARRSLEAERVHRAREGRRDRARLPEYASVVALARPEALDAALFDPTRPWELAKDPPGPPLVRGMVQRPLGWMVGRRAERRSLRRALLSPGRAGALLLGIGGIGKSTLAATMARRLGERGWSVVSVVGRVTLVALVRRALFQLEGAQLGEVGQRCVCELSVHDRRLRADQKVEPRQMLSALGRLLQHERVLLVFDNFEDNLPGTTLPDALERGGSTPAAAALSLETQELFEALLPAAQGDGAVLITCRYDLQDADELERVRLGPVAPVVMRRLLWRLPGLLELDAPTRRRALELLGGHPRALEFADALLRARSGSLEPAFDDIRRRVEALAQRRGEVLPHEVEGASVQDRVRQAVSLVAEDVLVDALVESLDEDTWTFLDAVAVYRRPVPEDALAAVAEAVGLGWDARRLGRGIDTLVSRTLLAESGARGRSWVVHRWVAARRHAQGEPARAHRAAAGWWLAPKVVDWEDGLEAVEHLLAAGELDPADELADHIRLQASRHGQTKLALTLSERMLEVFGQADARRAQWLGNLAEHELALVKPQAALTRYQEALGLFETLLARDPQSKELRRSTMVTLIRLTDVHRTGGELDAALEYARRASDLADELADEEPVSDERTRVSAVAHNTLGRLFQLSGDMTKARSHLEAGLGAARELAARHPEDFDMQRTLASSLGKLAELLRALEDEGKALVAAEESLEVYRTLASSDSARKDGQILLAEALRQVALLRGDRGLMDEALAICRRWLVDEPAHVGARGVLALTLLDRATLAQRLGDEQRCEKDLREAHQHLRALHSRDALSPALADTLDALDQHFADSDP